MKIKTLRLQNFKRFSDLTIELDPDNTGNIPKLVLLIGANGSGKSCVFDGFKVIEEISLPDERLYHLEENFKYRVKNSKLPTINFFLTRNDGKVLMFDYSRKGFEYQPISYRKNPFFQFYGRNSSKIVPWIKADPGVNFVDQTRQNLDNPALIISRDERFLSNVPTYNYLRQQGIDQVEENRVAKTIEEVNRIFYDPLNQSLENIFGDQKSPTNLIFKRILAPTTFGGLTNLVFQKGDYEILYEYLSQGEKQTIDTILDIMVRPQFYTDSIVYFDELDLHLHTSLQVNLIEEIVRLIPDNSQIWLSSHALGFINYARENGGAIIDFDSLDFDQKQILKLKPKNDNLEVYELAVPKSTLGQILLKQGIYFCEGDNDQYYNLLGIPNTLFIGGKSRDKNGVILEIKNTKYKGIIDRDYLTDEEIATLKEEYQNKLVILNFYAIENYWFHWENILEIDPNFDIESYKKWLVEDKNKTKIKMQIPASRDKYSYLKRLPNEKIKTEAKKIENILNSDNIEDFYPYFDVKKYFSHKPPFSKEQLTQTTWFKTKIKEVLSNF